MYSEHRKFANICSVENSLSKHICHIKIEFPFLQRKLKNLCYCNKNSTNTVQKRRNNYVFMVYFIIYCLFYKRLMRLCKHAGIYFNFKFRHFKCKYFACWPSSRLSRKHTSYMEKPKKSIFIPQSLYWQL